MSRRELRGWIYPAIVIGGSGAAITALVLLFERELPTRGVIGRVGSSDLRFTTLLSNEIAAALALAAAVSLGIYALLQWRGLQGLRPLRIATGALLTALLVVGLFNFFYAYRGVAKRHFVKPWDSFHYTLGPKYFEELGYYGIYDCTVTADRQSRRPVMRDRDKIRDLHNYRLIRVEKAIERSDCESRFSPARWQEFTDDVELFKRMLGRGYRFVLMDHGYNGTPFHAFLMRWVTNLPTLDYAAVVSLNLIDIVGLFALFVFVGRAFGWRLGFLFALFFVVNFADRAEYIIGSTGRYLWMITAGFGVAALKQQRYRLAAVMITAAAMLNVFPLLLFAGIGVKIAWGLIRRRSVEQTHKRFVIFAVATTLLLGALSITHGKGVGNYRDFLADMDLHTEIVGKSRVGFKFNFMFMGEVTEADKVVRTKDKLAQLERNSVPFWALVAAMLALGMAVVVRLDDVAATVLGGFLPFFLLFGTVEYYYAIMALLILIWHSRLGRPGGVAMLGLFFALTFVVYLAWFETQFTKFCNNNMLTWTITFYLVATLAYFGQVSGLWRDALGLARRLRGRRPA